MYRLTAVVLVSWVVLVDLELEITLSVNIRSVDVDTQVATICSCEHVRIQGILMAILQRVGAT